MYTLGHVRKCVRTYLSVYISHSAHVEVRKQCLRSVLSFQHGSGDGRQINRHAWQARLPANHLSKPTCRPFDQNKDRSCPPCSDTCTLPHLPFTEATQTLFFMFSSLACCHHTLLLEFWKVIWKKFNFFITMCVGYMCVYVCVCVCMHTSWHVCETQRATCRNHFSPFTKWVPGINWGQAWQLVP